MQKYKMIKAGIFTVTLLSFFCLLAGIAFQDRVTVTKTRSDTGFTSVQDVTEKEREQKNAPVGVRKEYTFRLNTDIDHDTSLAFYTVHQYVTVWLDGEEIYVACICRNHSADHSGSNSRLL